ncbi:MAG: hypothetical protein IIC55_03605 [Proteobacteria bacterium]|nr:hypothetical protein [Pseudomonadota bacterium]
MIQRLSIVSLFLALLSATPAGAAGPLVDAAWVKANIATDNVVFLDLRGNPRAFQAAHIPGARWTSYGRHGWRAKIKNVPGMLPPTAKLEALIGRFGIGFKSVYAFTDCPEIHSGDEHFAIESFVWPKGIPSAN